ncbi:TonB-dependent receptor [Piscinibacter sp.]|uniref:TonB-dependent receptor n=1 Tax=Piscinibacter sp. TaxID=1903157 RepID=UPI002B8F5CB0|nr:TonB-dependent receptor [Albitalea sp.]HUG25233.1 TonB-dependent receptor [Albitalea sp.]
MKRLSTHAPIPTRLALAVALAACHIGAAHAQAGASPQPAAPTASGSTASPASAAAPTAEPAPETEAKPQVSNDGLKLDAVIVTGTARGTSKMASSVSTSTMGAEQVQQVQSTSSAELIRNIPGVRSESSGGESNANVTVRGVPISAGGARYVQFQEDGLPVLQMGDFQFATPDTFIRVDNMLDRLEVVRGGSASTLATSAPGGIINFISKTGEEQGGIASLTLGLGSYDQTRYEFGYGGPLGTKTRFYIGGHQRSGEGARNGGVPIEKGGQLRANITHELDNGYVRLHFKDLDDRAPTLLPTPVRFVNGEIVEIPGIDPRSASFYSPYWVPDVTLTASNGHVSSNVNDGLSAKSRAFGVEVELEVGDGWRIQDRLRSSKNSGRFIGVFPGDDVRAADPGTVYLTGPNAGQAYDGDVVTAVVFNTSLDDMSLLANDLKVSKTFETGEGSEITATGGLYMSTQRMAQTWNFNQYLIEATGDKPALLDSPINGTPGFGGCCSNTIDATYRTTAPYLAANWELGALNVDASVRRDEQKATGSYNQSFFTGGVGGVSYNTLATRAIDYSVDHTSYSLGANFRVTPDLAVFARVSDGVAFNGDRIAFFNPAASVDGTAPVPVNEVQQAEAGVKWRHGGLSLFGTLFVARTTETNVDPTTTPIKVTSSKYDAKGAELEAVYMVGGLRLAGGLTVTDATVKESTNPALVGKTPRRQAKVVYQLSPTYNIGGLTVGASVVGTTKSMDDSPAGPISVTLPAYAVVNAFVNYELSSHASINLGVNNLFDKVGYTETNDGRGAARSVNGRTAKATLAYEF